MPDVAWITLEVWPWNDAWLAQDDGLAQAFAEVDLLEPFVGSPEWKLVGAMNGERNDFEAEDGLPARTVLSGEMTGASYQIEDTNLLDELRVRGIAYRLVGDASPKYDWDGSEVFWHPGMEAPFAAVHTVGGRVLDRHRYDGFVEEAGPGRELNFKIRLAGLVQAFFAPDPYVWRPPDGYAPTLNPAAVEEPS